MPSRSPLADVLRPFSDTLPAAPAPDFLANAHVHLPPNFTAFDTTAQAVDLAAAQGVAVLGASNYYDYTVYQDFAQGAIARGVFPLFGIEIITLVDELVVSGVKINDPGNPGKMYLCGKGITRFDPLSPRASELLGTIRKNDTARMEAVTEKLSETLAQAGLRATLTAGDIRAQIAARHNSPLDTVYLQERHIAQAFQEAVFAQIPAPARAAFWERAYGVAPKSGPDDAVGVQNEIRSQLMKAGKPAFVPDTFVDFAHGYDLVCALGGIPCYPTLADGASPITGYEADVDALVADIKARGICAGEFIPLRNTPGVLSRYVRAMREAGLFVTSGTEHNTRDLLPLAPACLNDEPIPADIAAIFREGACVVAAHQYRTLRGEGGFMDAADYPTSDARIVAFADLGASVLAEYGVRYPLKGGLIISWTS